jgi:polyhydroxybutyrate depolymerase
MPGSVNFLPVTILILLALVGWLLGTPRFLTPRATDDQNGSIVYQGRKRNFLLHIPEKVRGEKGAPLVLVLHGGGGTPEAVARLTGFSKLADKEGFIVVYPEAVNRHWNDGRDVKRFLAHRENIDDVGFIARLIDTLIRQLGVDSSRVYAAGMSNGGMMCQRLGCELSPKLAAFASVGASLPENLTSQKPVMPISVLMINGTADPIVPFSGGGVGRHAKRGRVVSVPEAIEFWVKANGCDSQPRTTTLVKSDTGLAVEKTVYQAGQSGAEVILLTVEGGGHTWPGGKKRPSHFGRLTDAVNASEIIWEFFLRHRR